VQYADDESGLSAVRMQYDENKDMHVAVLGQRYPHLSGALEMKFAM